MTDLLMLAIAALGFSLLAGVIRYAGHGIDTDGGPLS